MASERRFLLHGAEATVAVGEALGALLEPGDVLALDGDLGAGKTTLVRGVARGLGVEDDVASPTYILMDALEGGRLPLFHFDAWMEGRERALFLDGGDEWLRAGGVAVVEWADRVREWLPTPRLEVRLEHRSPEARALLLVALGGGPSPAAAAAAPHGWAARLAALDLGALEGVEALAEPGAGGVAG